MKFAVGGADKAGFFRCGRPHFWCKKTRFFEIYGVLARIRKVKASADIFRTRRGIIFS